MISAIENLDSLKLLQVCGHSCIYGKNYGGVYLLYIRTYVYACTLYHQVPHYGTYIIGTYVSQVSSNQHC